MDEISNLIKSCEQAWTAIQLENQEIPDAVVIVGSGGRRAVSLLGHYAKDRWEFDGQLRPEVLIVAEQLKRPAKDIFQTLLHESAHALAHARDIQDCSGRRHNKKFAQLCLEIGLIPPEKADRALGYSAATLNEFAEEHYMQSILGIEKALVLCRKLSLLDQLKKPVTTHKLECGCGRKLTVSDKFYNEGEVMCVECNRGFEEV